MSTFTLLILYILKLCILNMMYTILIFYFLFKIIFVVQLNFPFHINLELTIREGNGNFSTLAWKIPWAEKTGRLQCTGSLRVGHD